MRFGSGSELVRGRGQMQKPSADRRAGHFVVAAPPGGRRSPKAISSRALFKLINDCISICYKDFLLPVRPLRRFFPLYAACFGEQMANRNEHGVFTFVAPKSQTEKNYTKRHSVVTWGTIIFEILLFVAVFLSQRKRVVFLKLGI